MSYFPPLDMFMLLGASAFAVWELHALITARSKITLKGRVFARTASIVLLGLMACAALWARRNDFVNFYLICGAVGAAFALYIPLPSGLTEDGMYHNGKFILYVKFKFHAVEHETEAAFSLRLSTGTKEYVLEFPLEQKPLVLAHMYKGKVPDVSAVIKGGKAGKP